MIAFAGPDALKIESASVEVSHLHLIGTIPGVIPLLAAARNGPGSGMLKSIGDGTRFQWRAPDSGTFGTPVLCASDGNCLLLDGEDTNKWLRIQVDASELANGARSTVVELTDRFNNAIASDDVSAAEATAGDVETYTFDLENQSNTILSQLSVWIDPTVVNIEIADDGATWVSPTTQATALVLPDLLPGVSDTLHVRRTITAGAGSDGGLLNLLRFSWRG
jgi:hypothetical protein